MARRRVVRRLIASEPVLQQQKLWPVSVAVFALGAYSLSIILRHTNFGAPSILKNGWFHVGVWGVIMGALAWSVIALRGRVLVRIQASVLISLLLHLLLLDTLADRYVRMLLSSTPDEAVNLTRLPTDIPTIPEYVLENPEREAEQENFEKKVETPLPEDVPTDQQRQAAQSQDVPVPQQDMQQPPRATLSTEPSPLAVKRPEISAPRLVPQPSGQQISRRETSQTLPNERVETLDALQEQVVQRPPTPQIPTPPKEMADAPQQPQRTSQPEPTVQPQQREVTLTRRNDTPAPQPTTEPSVTAPTRQTAQLPQVRPAEVEPVERPSEQPAPRPQPQDVAMQATRPATVNPVSAPPMPRPTPQTQSQPQLADVTLPPRTPRQDRSAPTPTPMPTQAAPARSTRPVEVATEQPVTPTAEPAVAAQSNQPQVPDAATPTNVPRTTTAPQAVARTAAPATDAPAMTAAPTATPTAAPRRQAAQPRPEATAATQAAVARSQASASLPAAALAAEAPAGAPAAEAAAAAAPANPSAGAMVSKSTTQPVAAASGAAEAPAVAEVAAQVAAAPARRTSNAPQANPSPTVNAQAGAGVARSAPAPSLAESVVQADAPAAMAPAATQGPAPSPQPADNVSPSRSTAASGPVAQPSSSPQSSQTAAVQPRMVAGSVARRSAGGGAPQLEATTTPSTIGRTSTSGQPEVGSVAVEVPQPGAAAPGARATQSGGASPSTPAVSVTRAEGTLPQARPTMGESPSVPSAATGPPDQIALAKPRLADVSGNPSPEPTSSAVNQLARTAGEAGQPNLPAAPVEAAMLAEAVGTGDPQAQLQPAASETVKAAAGPAMAAVAAPASAEGLPASVEAVLRPLPQTSRAAGTDSAAPAVVQGSESAPRRTASASAVAGEALEAVQIAALDEEDEEERKRRLAGLRAAQTALTRGETALPDTALPTGSTADAAPGGQPAVSPAAIPRGAAGGATNRDAPQVAVAGGGSVARTSPASALAAADMAAEPLAQAESSSTAEPGSGLQAASTPLSRSQTGLPAQAAAAQPGNLPSSAVAALTGDVVRSSRAAMAAQDDAPGIAADLTAETMLRQASAASPMAHLAAEMVETGGGPANPADAAAVLSEPDMAPTRGGATASLPAGAAAADSSQQPAVVGPQVAGGQPAAARRDSQAAMPTATAAAGASAPRRAAPVELALHLPAGVEAAPMTPQADADSRSLPSPSVTNAAAGPRSLSGIPVRLAAAEGPGALTTGPSIPEVGTPNRLARAESQIAHTTPQRFLLQRAQGPVMVDAEIAADPVPAFAGRSPQMRRELGGKQGGTAGTERAVEMALAFLARVQSDDGHWSLHAFGDQRAGNGGIAADTAGTGLALLAYLGAGYTHLEGKYRQEVRRGLDWLLAHQKPDGDLFTGGHQATWFYSHGIATIALCEAYGMTRDPDLREPAQKAVDFIVASQHPELGGWRYAPRSESDTSVSGWQLMALRSATLSGLDVPETAYEGVARWLDRAGAGGSGSRYAYNPLLPNEPKHDLQRRPSLAMTAEALLMRMYLGWDRDTPEMRAGADYLRQHLPKWTRSLDGRDSYYWYYATQVMFQMQGPHWEDWNSTMRDLLPKMQVQSGPLAGSWEPRGPVPDRWGAHGGRVYVTAMHALMLEVYYRHLPLFETLAPE